MGCYSNGYYTNFVSAAGGTNNVVRIQGTPSVNVSVTTTYNYRLTLSGTCDPDVVETGSIQVDLGPDIDEDYIQNFLVKDVECYNDNTGSIVLRRHIITRLLKCNKKYKTWDSSNF